MESYVDHLQYQTCSHTPAEIKSYNMIHLTFTGPCIANTLAEYNQYQTCSHMPAEIKSYNMIHLTFTGPCIANTLAEYNQQDATFHNLFISVRCSTCSRRIYDTVVV